MAERWSIEHKAALPRTLYRGLKLPLCFVVFAKDGRRLLRGFALYREVEEVGELPEAYQRILARAPRSAWLRCVVEAIRKLGGRATLQQLYAEIGGSRPTETAWWREKVRQVAQRYTVRLGNATYGVSA
jgi:site-specific DNA-methyltransferase (adenine-specific)